VRRYTRYNVHQLLKIHQTVTQSVRLFCVKIKILNKCPLFCPLFGFLQAESLGITGGMYYSLPHNGAFSFARHSPVLPVVVLIELL
jgi:hypothetical protein